MAGKPYAAVEGGLLLAVRLTPRGGRPGLDGLGAGPEGRPLLLLRVAAAPVDGAANEALTALLAEVLGLRRSAVTLRSGARARVKRVLLAGDPDDLRARLERWIGTGPA